MKGKGFISWRDTWVTPSDTFDFAFFFCKFPKKMPFKLFQLNWAKWIHFTKQILQYWNSCEHRYQKNPANKAKFAKNNNNKKTYFCTTILHDLYAKIFKLESISFHYFSPRTLKIKQVWTLDFGKGGAKRRLNGVNKWRKKIHDFFLLRQFTPFWKGNRKKWSQIWKLLLMKGVNCRSKKKFMELFFHLFAPFKRLFAPSAQNPMSKLVWF